MLGRRAAVGLLRGVGNGYRHFLAVAGAADFLRHRLGDDVFHFRQHARLQFGFGDDFRLRQAVFLTEHSAEKAFQLHAQFFHKVQPRNLYDKRQRQQHQNHQHKRAAHSAEHMVHARCGERAHQTARAKGQRFIQMRVKRKRFQHRAGNHHHA